MLRHRCLVVKDSDLVTHKKKKHVKRFVFHLQIAEKEIEREQELAKKEMEQTTKQFQVTSKCIDVSHCW